MERAEKEIEDAVRQLEQNRLDEAQRYFLYLKLVQCQLSLRDFEKAKKNLAVLRVLRPLNEYCGLQLATYSALLAHLCGDGDCEALIAEAEVEWQRISEAFLQAHRVRTLAEAKGIPGMRRRVEGLCCKRAEILELKALHSPHDVAEVCLEEAVDIARTGGCALQASLAGLRLLQLQGKWPEFENAATEIMRTFPDTPQAQELLAPLSILYLRQNQTHKAAVLGEGDSIIQALIEFHQGHYEQAIASLDGLPPSPFTLNLAANAMFNLGRFNDARELYKKLGHAQGVVMSSVKLLDSETAWVVLNDLLSRCQNADYATEESPAILNLAGMVLQAENKLADADEMFRQALGLKRSPEIAFNLGFNCMLLGDLEKAIAPLTAVISAETGRRLKQEACEALKSVYQELYQKTKSEAYLHEIDALGALVQ